MHTQNKNFQQMLTLYTEISNKCNLQFDFLQKEFKLNDFSLFFVGYFSGKQDNLSYLKNMFSLIKQVSDQFTSLQRSMKDNDDGEFSSFLDQSVLKLATQSEATDAMD